MIKAKLNLFDIIMIIISLVIGVGIFRTPQSVANKSESEIIFFSAWIFGGIIALCGALTFAEVGSRLPVAGGFYKLFSFSYHPAYAFMLNWAQVVVNAASAAGVGIIGAQYISPLILSPAQQTDFSIRIIVVVIVVVLFLLNFIGIKTGARTQNVLSGLKIILILTFCLGIFYSGEKPTSITHLTSGGNILSAFCLSLVPVFFTYGGYQNTVNFGADVKDAKRNIPRGIFIGVITVLILYLSINFAYVHVLGFENMKHSTLVASDLAGKMFGADGFKLASIAIFISVLGFINTSILSNPRVYYAMAEEKTLPRIFSKVNSKTQVQEFAITFFVALVILSLFVFKTFDEIVNYVMFIDTIGLASAGASIFIFRKKAGKSDTHTGFKMKLYPVVPAIFMMALVLVNIYVVYSDPKDSLIGFCILLLGYPIYRGMKKLNG